MASVREWQFKRKFRTNAYGWRASSLAIGRLKEAAAEIRSVAKSDPVAAGDGVVSLMERIWPALQGIDTSSGALGAAVFRTVNEANLNPDRRGGGPRDQKQVAREIVRGGAKRRRRISGSAR